MAGPLRGVHVVEMAAIGPVPFCATVLADLGADVVRVDRVGDVRAGGPGPAAALGRGRRSVAVDVKHADGGGLVRRIVAGADVLLEGFRPGVMERLGLGPEVFRAVHPRLVYGRMTGFGQSGPLARAAGHDVNYLALSGVLGALGPAGGPPAPPLNLVGDYGGGLFLAVGVLAALRARDGTGEGQVVDCSMVEAAAMMMSANLPYMQDGTWTAEPGANIVDGGSPFYGAYRTRDGRWVAFGAIEPQFYAGMLRGLGLDGERVEDQHDRSRWAGLRARIADVVAGRTRDEWVRAFDGIDACFSPVLAPLEAPAHDHNVARATFVELDGYVQAAPAPRFSADDPGRPRPAPAPGADTAEVLSAVGVDVPELEDLVDRGVVAVAVPER